MSAPPPEHVLRHLQDIGRNSEEFTALAGARTDNCAGARLCVAACRPGAPIQGRPALVQVITSSIPAPRDRSGAFELSLT